MEGAVAMARMAIKFIGNASVQISQERRKKAIMDMNPKLVDMAESDTIFEDAVPNLFGNKQAKDREDQLQVLGLSLRTRQKPQTFSIWLPSGSPLRGAAILPPAGEASEKGDASSHTTNTKKLKEKKTITRKGPEEPSEEAETTRVLRTADRTS